MSDLGRIVRNSGLAEGLMPKEAIRQQRALAQVVDANGAIDPKAAAPFRTPLVMHWSPGSTERQRAARAGTAVLLAAHANVAPTTGAATVTLTAETPTSGSTTIATLSIPLGVRMAEVTINAPVLAGTWLLATVTNANGASNVSMSLTMSVG